MMKAAPRLGFYTIALLVAVVAHGQQATIIYDISGVRVPLGGGGGAAVTDFQFLSDGWSQTKTYVGVSISAELPSFPPPVSSGTAYLTTRIGSGTTPSDQIASTNFAFPPSFSPRITLFSGLTLPPGTYFLTISAAPGSAGGWETIAEANATFTTDAGVLPQPPAPSSGFFFTNVGSEYPPAAVFFNYQPIHPVFTVTGAIVPEPSTFALEFAGLIFFACAPRAMTFAGAPPRAIRSGYAGANLVGAE
jgi:hypothetical protein